MNEQNLIPGNMRSQNELREQGRKGGQASGKARREKKAVKQIILDVLYSDSPNGGTVLEDMVAGMIERVSKTGDQATFEKIMEYAGMSSERKRKDADLKLRKDALELQKEQSAFRTGTDTQRQEPAIRARAALMAQVEAEMRSDGSDS